MKKRPTTRPPCPSCASSSRVVPIEYGEPPPSVAKAAERGELVLGGCCIAPDSPPWACLACGARFAPSSR